MYGVSLFVVREVFEIALIVSIVLAATRGVVGRGRFISLGFVSGVVGAALIALFTDSISAMADGMGQELMNAAILLAAAAMIGWTAVWMRVHGRELAGKMKAAAAESEMWVISAIIALAVFREGAEMVLFTYGAHAQGTSWAEIMSGGAIGIVGGVVIGTLFYLGVITLFAKHFLNITSTLLAFLAAGLAAKGVYFLAMIGMVPEFGSQLWDSSAFVSNSSIVGQSLGVLIGYNATPSGVELITYLVVLAVIFAALAYALRELKKQQFLANNA